MADTYEQTRADLARLLQQVGASFPAEQTRYVEDFIDANEYQLALEWMLDGLIELDLPLPPDAEALARDLATRLGITGEIGERLTRLESRRRT